MTTRGATYERKERDEYMTPEWAVEALLSVERLAGPVWEPACGHGAIVRVIERLCPRAVIFATDIDPTYSMNMTALDFMTATRSAVAAEARVLDGDEPITIATNPPYGPGGKLALAFVERALMLTIIERGKVIMLLPSDWDCAKGRRHLFEGFAGHLTKVTLTSRIRWTNLKQSVAGPSSNHAWFIWDHARKGRDMRWV